MKNALLIVGADRRATVFGDGREEEIARRTRLVTLSPGECAARLDILREVEVIFSTWGMPAFTPDQLDGMPHLQAVFYAAGTVQGFARPLLERGVVVVSAWQANAIPVAEFALAQVLLSLKGYFRNVREAQSGVAYRKAHCGVGAYGETVALLGAGAVGRHLVERLRPFQIRVVVFDPFLSDEDAESLGVEKVGLAEAFARGQVVSNHLADKPETAGLIDRTLLDRLRPGATFLNTGRGRTVREEDLAAVCAARPDVTALLDVTYPEPPLADNLLWALPNVQISTHIAGANGDEVRRLADLCLDAFDRWERGEPVPHQVTLAMLERMA